MAIYLADGEWIRPGCAPLQTTDNSDVFAADVWHAPWNLLRKRYREGGAMKLRQGSPFSEYLESNRRRLAQMLLRKAFVANRLAKISQGATRQMLYDLKHKHLSAAVELLPDSFYVDHAAAASVVGVRTQEGFAFHVPVERLTDNARELLALSA